MTPDRCAAYQVSDQKTCPRCQLTWDTNDENPPACKPTPLPAPRTKSWFSRTHRPGFAARRNPKR